LRIDLTGRVALVTGGGSGIGRASCLALAGAGARVAVFGRTLAKAEAVAEEIAALGGAAFAGQADVARGEDVRAMIAATVERFGGLDILFNNAGISPAGSVTEITEEEWDACIATDLRSVFLGAKYAIPELRRRGGGAILSTAGTFGIRAARGKAAYAAAKAGVVNLTRSIALDYARDNIRCNVICPGYVDTPLNDGFAHDLRDAFLDRYQPLPGLVAAEDVAALTVFLASDSARMITGQAYLVDAGQQAGLF
jgi:NAD(P)-dependent dehydrogenase (short-subunit alcohol dehydrogenase family)